MWSKDTFVVEAVRELWLVSQHQQSDAVNISMHRLWLALQHHQQRHTTTKRSKGKGSALPSATSSRAKEGKTALPLDTSS